MGVVGRMTGRLSVGVIGVGSTGHHARVYQVLPAVELVERMRSVAAKG